MSIRLTLLAAVGALAVTPAFAIQTNFAAVQGSSTPFVLPSGDNTLTFSSPSDPGTFSVATTAGLFSFPVALGNFSSFGGDTLSIAFAKPVTAPLALTFGLEDAFDTNGSDTLTVTTNTGAQATFNTTLDSLAFSEPEGTGTISAVGFTSLTITSANPFAVASIATVPEPASMALLGAGLLGLVAVSRRRR